MIVFVVAVVAYLLIGVAFYTTLTAIDSGNGGFWDIVAGIHNAGKEVVKGSVQNWVSTICATLFVLFIWPAVLVAVVAATIAGGKRGS